MRLLTTSIIAASALMLASPQAAGQSSEKDSVKPKTSQTAPAAAETNVDLTVSGMTWGVGCVRKVQSALSKVPGVIKAEVSMPDKAVVKFDKNKVTVAKLVDAVKKAGYTAKEKKSEKEQKKI